MYRYWFCNWPGIGRADAGIVLCNVIKYIKHIYWLGQGEILFQTHEYMSNIKFIWILTWDFLVWHGMIKVWIIHTTSTFSNNVENCNLVTILIMSPFGHIIKIQILWELLHLHFNTTCLSYKILEFNFSIIWSRFRLIELVILLMLCY